MSALKKSAQASLFEPYEPTHYLGGNSQSSAYFALLTQDCGATTKRQRSYPVDSMGFVIAHCDKSLDTWISQAEFWAPTRRLLHFMRVGLLFVDLDTYKHPALAGMSAEAQLEHLLRLCEAQGVPAPSLVIFSGRGLQAKWLLTAPVPARALPRWSLVQRELGLRLTDMGADANALDASRVLRLVHTVNSKSGQVVRVLHNSAERYDFDKLADGLLPLTRAELAQLRERRAQDETPTVRAGATTTRGHLTAVDTSQLKGLRPFIGAQLAWDRLHDLRKLAELRGWTRGAPDGSRDLAVFVGASFLAQAVPNVPRFYDELRVLGREFCPHWSLSEVHSSASAVISRMRMLASGQTVEYKGLQVDPRYRWRNSTLIERFCITPAEERELRTLISETEAGRRHAQRERERRHAAGAVSRQEYLTAAADKRTQAQQLRAQGLSLRAVAAQLGVSVGAVHGYLKG